MLDLKVRLTRSGKWAVRSMAIVVVGLLGKVDAATATELSGSENRVEGQNTDQLEYIDDENIVFDDDPNNPPAKPE